MVGAVSAARAAVPLAIAALVALGAPAGATKIDRQVSPAGIEFWFVRDATVPLVAIEFAFRGGSVQDPDDKGGLAEMTVSTLDEGAGDLDATAFHARMERRAIELQIRASREHVRGTLRTLKENQDEAFELLRLALNQPRFDQAAVERMRAQTIASLQRQSTNPNSIASRRWWAAAFPDHPYGRPVSGTIESVARVTPDDMRDYVRRVFARDNLRLGVVGDIDAETAGRLIDRTFAALPATAQLKPVPATALHGLGGRSVVDLNVPQAVVTFGSPGIARNDPDFMAAYIVNHILGGGSFSSRLYREVREVRGLAYGVSTSLLWFDSAAVLIGGTATRADATAETIAVIEREFQRMAANGPTEEELAKTKTYLKGAFALNLDTSSKIASQLVQMQIDNLGIDYIERRSAMIDAVTLADARRVAKRLLDGGLLVTVVGRPKGVTERSPGG
ncbi:MAG: insulinase family protein [Hyphomicrobiales bacterium]|nr:insulinase family protein [Hyphomicrobiales bacterium]